jgi:exonuclease III
MDMELLSLNTNGLREDTKRRSLFTWLKKFHNAEEKIVFLQETHTDASNVSLWMEDWGHKNIFFAHGDSRSRGTAIILPNSDDIKINSSECDPNGRYVALNITIKDNDFFIINGYAPTSNNSALQIEWLTKIQNIIEQVSDMNLIIGGDLNDYFIPALDKYNPIKDLAETEYIKMWKVICDDLNLMDIWRTLNPSTKRYTWRQGKTVDTLKQSRLDYWLISTHMIYDLTNVDIEPGFRSDHSLIEINFKSSKETKRGPSYWRFNSNLLSNITYTTYMNNRIDEIMEKHKDIGDKGLKWDVVKMEIRSSTVCFSKKLAKKNRDHIHEVILDNDRLSKLIEKQPSEQLLQEYEATKLEIEYYNNEKANGVRLRAKVDWAEIGERNTKFVLNLEKRNYKNKCITKLINEEDKIVENKNDILEYEARYYKNLYTNKMITNENENPQDEFFMDPDTPKLKEEDKMFCEQDINITEISAALKE